MTKPLTKEQLEVFVHLRGSGAGQALIKILRERVAAFDAANRTTDGAEMHRGQGKAIALDDLVREIEDSPNQIQRLEPRQKAQL